MRNIVNSELLRLAASQFNKTAFMPGAAAGGGDPSAGGGDPSAGGGGAPDPTGGGTGAIDPNAMAAQAAPPMDPSMAGGGAPAAPPAAAPASSPTGGAPAQQKLKPEQMMQMIDYRLYNMQQQLTAIMNTLGVQLPPEAIVLPPGSTSAPAPETALPGGAGAPTPTPPPAGGGGDPSAGGGQLPQNVYAGPDPSQNGGAVQPIPPVKAANWWEMNKKITTNPDLQEAAAAAAAVYRSRAAYDN